MSETVKRARESLRAAVDRACIARGEARWTNGYLCGSSSRIAGDEKERLYQKELAQLKQAGVAEATMERAMRAYAAAVRGSVVSRRRSR